MNLNKKHLLVVALIFITVFVHADIKDITVSPVQKNVADPLRDVRFDEYLKCYRSLQEASDISDFYNIKELTYYNVRPTPVPTPEPELIPRSIEHYTIDDKGEYVVSNIEIVYEKPELTLDEIYTEPFNANVELFVIPTQVGNQKGYAFLNDSNSYFLPFSEMGDSTAFKALGVFGYNTTTWPVNLEIAESKIPLEYVFMQEKVPFSFFFNQDTRGVSPADAKGWTTVNFFKAKLSMYESLLYKTLKNDAKVPQVKMQNLDKNLTYLILFSRMTEALDTIALHFKKELQRDIQSNKAKILADQHFSELDACEILGVDLKVPVNERRNFLISLHLARLGVFKVLNSK